MPFRLKNVGATYQRLVNKMFHDLLKKMMEVYIDDMLIKSLRVEDHIKHLKQSFEVLQKYNMKLNPTKYVFGVASGKFLGYIVMKRGIEENLEQIKSVLNIASPTCKKDVQKLIGRVVALSCFISRSSGRKNTKNSYNN